MPAQTVSQASIICMCVSLLICVGLPAGLAIWGKVKYKKAFSFIPMLLGAVGFFIFQIIIRATFLLPWIQSIGWVKSLLLNPIHNIWFLWVYAAFLAITAGLFEEPVRFAVFSILKKKRNYPDGFSYGIGHGGTEAIILAGLSYYINIIIYSIMINTGTWNTLLATVPASELAALTQTGQQLASAQPWTFLVGGAERLFTIFIQIGLSLVVLKGFTANKKWLYLALAIGLHALIDFPAALADLGVLKVSMWALEGFVLVAAAIALLYIKKQARDYKRSLPGAEMMPDGGVEIEKFFE